MPPPLPRCKPPSERAALNAKLQTPERQAKRAQLQKQRTEAEAA